jgi:hypothetical protein
VKAEINMFHTHDSPFKQGIPVIEFHVKDEQLLTKMYRGSILWGKVNLLCDRLLWKYGIPSHYFIQSIHRRKFKPIIYLLATSQVKEKYHQLKVDDREWTIFASSSQQKLMRPDDPVGAYIIEGIVRRMLHNRLKRHPWIKDGSRYISKILEREIFVGSRKIYVNRGFRFDVHVFEDGDIGLWIDIVHKLSQPLLDIIYDDRNRLKPNYLQILETIKEEGRTVFAKTRKHTIMSGRIRRILDITNKEAQFKTDGGKTSLFDYWQKYYSSDNIAVPPADKPVLVIVPLTGIPRETYWPLRCFNFRKNSYEPVLYLNPMEEEIYPPTLSPGQRREEILRIAREILYDLKVANITLKFAVEGKISLAEPYFLAESRKILFAGYLKKWSPTEERTGPLLKFRKGTTTEAATGFTDLFPLMGHQLINVVGIVPRGKERDFTKFIRLFNENVSCCKIEFDPNETISVPLFGNIVDKYSDAAYRAAEKLKLKNIPKGALVIIPRKGMKRLYYGIKKEFYKQGIIPQILTTRTLEGVLYERKSIAVLLNIASSLYYNSVQDLYLEKISRNEKPEGISWILENPAGNAYGGKESTVFVGFDVSSHPEFGEKYGVAVTLCDSHGKLVHVEKQHTEDYLQFERVRTILDDTFNAIKRHVGPLENLERFVFYRDGRLLPEERDAITYAASDIIKEKSLPESFKMDIISVPKSGEERIFEVNRVGERIFFENPSPGFAIILNSREAVFSNTKFVGKKWRKRTVKPLRIRFEGTVPDGAPPTDMKQLISEFLDLSMLDWASIAAQPKLPLPLLLAHQISQVMAYTAGQYLTQNEKINI